MPTELFSSSECGQIKERAFNAIRPKAITTSGETASIVRFKNILQNGYASADKPVFMEEEDVNRVIPDKKTYRKFVGKTGAAVECEAVFTGKGAGSDPA